MFWQLGQNIAFNNFGCVFIWLMTSAAEAFTLELSLPTRSSTGSFNLLYRRGPLLTHKLPCLKASSCIFVVFPLRANIVSMTKPFSTSDRTGIPCTPACLLGTPGLRQAVHAAVASSEYPVLLLADAAGADFPACLLELRKLVL